MKSLAQLRKEKGVLVAAHRGTSGGNIPPNTIAAFDLALKEGADILEMDLFKSLDGEIFVFHTGTEPCYLDRHPELVLASQEYLKDQYKAEVDQWGYIDPERWNAFYQWLNENELTETEIPENAGFSNDYLPE